MLLPYFVPTIPGILNTMNPPILHVAASCKRHKTSNNISLGYLARTLLLPEKDFTLQWLQGFAALNKETSMGTCFESTNKKIVDIILDWAEFVNVDALTRSAAFKVLA